MDGWWDTVEIASGRAGIISLACSLTGGTRAAYKARTISTYTMFCVERVPGSLRHGLSHHLTNVHGYIDLHSYYDCCTSPTQPTNYHHHLLEASLLIYCPLPFLNNLNSIMDFINLNLSTLDSISTFRRTCALTSISI